MPEVLGRHRSTMLGGRAAAMAERLTKTARDLGIAETGIGRIVAAYETAMRPRERYLDSDHHPDFLHPGRTALILMLDTELRDPVQLAAGALLETWRPELAAATVDDEVRALLAEIPSLARDGELLAEALLLADPAVCTIALAERLDQVRHLHLRPLEEWEALHHETEEIYLPIALRTEPTMARRYRWWCRTFRERFLGGTRAGRAESATRPATGPG